jgi:hypothetical protein
VAKRDLYETDELHERIGAAEPKLNLSRLWQPVAGYAVLHGQEATEAALRQALSNGHHMMPAAAAGPADRHQAA